MTHEQYPGEGQDNRTRRPYEPPAVIDGVVQDPPSSP